MATFNRTRGSVTAMPKYLVNDDSPEVWAARFPWPEPTVCRDTHRPTVSDVKAKPHVHSRRRDPETGRRRTFTIDPETGQWIRPETIQAPSPVRRRRATKD